MQLQEVISGLSECPAEIIIFAERIDGQFRSESAAIALVLSEADLSRPLREIVAERAPGKEYFLEAAIALEMLTEWRSGPTKLLPELAALVERMIGYAEHDA